ncbi:MAG: ribbon-helix-helix domain-containing protein [Candidatus Bathyarchaeia archaeon]
MEYTTISIPKDLAQQIDEAIKVSGQYKNRSDFVIDAIRRQLEKIRRKSKETA